MRSNNFAVNSINLANKSYLNDYFDIKSETTRVNSAVCDKHNYNLK